MLRHRNQLSTAADAGYCSEHNLTCPGPDRLIATGKGRDLEKAARDPGSEDPGWGGPAVQAMRERLKTPDGLAACRQRGHIAETPAEAGMPLVAGATPPLLALCVVHPASIAAHVTPAPASSARRLRSS